MWWHSFSPAAGGTSEGIRKLAQSCAGRVEVVCLDDPAEPYVQGQSFPVHALGPAQGSYRYTPRLQPWLAQNLDRFDGVVIHGLWQWHSYGSYRVVRHRTPYVVFPHGMLDPYFKRAFPLKHFKKQVYWLAREYRVLRDARAVCFTTPIERDPRRETLWPQRWNPAVVSLGTSEPVGIGARNGKCFLAAIRLCADAGFFCFCRAFKQERMRFAAGSLRARGAGASGFGPGHRWPRRGRIAAPVGGAGEAAGD